MAIVSGNVIALATGGVLYDNGLISTGPGPGPDFPTLSENPDAENFGQVAADDPTIRSRFVNGFVQSRTEYPSAPRVWIVLYRFLPTADKDLVEAFEKTVAYGGSPFNWANPEDDTVYEVRFAGRVGFKIEPRLPYTWKITFLVEEVNAPE